MGFPPSFKPPLVLKTPVLLGLCLLTPLTVLTVLTGALSGALTPHPPTPVCPWGLTRPGLASMTNCNVGLGLHPLPKALLETPSWLSPGPRAELWGCAGPCSSTVQSHRALRQGGYRLEPCSGSSFRVSAPEACPWLRAQTCPCRPDLVLVCVCSEGRPHASPAQPQPRVHQEKCSVHYLSRLRQRQAVRGAPFYQTYPKN